METKVLEIRDDGTLIPVVAFSTIAGNDAERYLLERAGFDQSEHRIGSVVVVRFHETQAQYSPHKWPGGARTMLVAHLYIKEHFNELKSGDVVDVEHIMGLRTTAKLSERFMEYLEESYSDEAKLDDELADASPGFGVDSNTDNPASDRGLGDYALDSPYRNELMADFEARR